MHPVDGTYMLEFRSSRGGLGFGMVVLDQGKINGGNQGYAYRGRYVYLEPAALRAQLHITRWSQEASSVFGPLESFTLAAEAELDSLGFHGEGQVQDKEELTVSIHGQRIAPLAE